MHDYFRYYSLSLEGPYAKLISNSHQKADSSLVFVMYIFRGLLFMLYIFYEYFILVKLLAHKNIKCYLIHLLV